MLLKGRKRRILRTVQFRYYEAPARQLHLTFPMKKDRMSHHECLKREIFFDCANAIEPFRCFKCANFETHNLAHLKHHSKAGHTPPERRYRCGSCNFRTHSSLIMLKHKSVNACMTIKEIKYEASHVGGEYETDTSTPKPFKCDTCPFETKYNTSLKNHILIKHTDLEKIQWFECAQCPFKCKTNTLLSGHTHYKHKPVDRQYVRCGVCAFQTRYKQTLRRHVLLKHTESEKIEWFQCAQCAYKTHRKDRLKTHADYKHGSVYLKCDACPFETKFVRTLKDHTLRKHADPEKIEWFFCAHCAYKSRIKKYLQRHAHIHGRTARAPSKRSRGQLS